MRLLLDTVTFLYSIAEPGCQAIVQGLVIVTPDEAIARYPVLTLW